MASEHQVAIVVDGRLSPKLEQLSRARHVWAVKTPETERAARDIWGKPSAQGRDWNEQGVTIFNGSATPEDSLLSILDAVVLHHGEYSHDPPLSGLDVLGVAPSAELRAALRSLGFTNLTPTPDGFAARRDPS